MTYSLCHTIPGSKEMGSSSIFTELEFYRNDRVMQNRFIMDMDPLVRKTASKYDKYYCQFSDDIYVAAQTGLFKAMMNFDFTYRGFVKYASKSMETEIRHFLSNETRLIRIPANVSDKQRKIKACVMKNPAIDDDEIIKELGLSSHRTLKRIRNAETALSLDGGNYLSLASDECSPERETTRKDERQEIEKALMALESTERYIIEHSYALGGKEKKRVKDMASDLSVTTQTVINRRRIALEKLRASLSNLMT